jgi:hypothetical protein
MVKEIPILYLDLRRTYPRYEMADEGSGYVANVWLGI